MFKSQVFHLLRKYADEQTFKAAGAQLIRPWQLPHRGDYGLRGTADSENWHLFQCKIVLFDL